jgi:hypothetical protein
VEGEPGYGARLAVEHYGEAINKLAVEGENDE